MSTIIDGSAGVTTNAGGSVNPSTNVEGINFSCRAWVNFNGTGTVAIRASGNVSSITDNGTGDYTVNFTTAMTDANYAVGAFYGNTATTFAMKMSDATVPTSSAVRVNVFNTGTAVIDCAQVHVSIFR